MPTAWSPGPSWRCSTSWRRASASTGPSAGCSSSAANPRPWTRGSGCTEQVAAVVDRAAQAVVELVGDLLERRQKMIKWLLVAAVVVGVAAVASQTS